jgi:hypothetical protein
VDQTQDVLSHSLGEKYLAEWSTSHSTQGRRSLQHSSSCLLLYFLLYCPLSCLLYFLLYCSLTLWGTSPTPTTAAARRQGSHARQPHHCSTRGWPWPQTGAGWRQQGPHASRWALLYPQGVAAGYHSVGFLGVQGVGHLAHWRMLGRVGIHKYTVEPMPARWPWPQTGAGWRQRGLHAYRCVWRGGGQLGTILVGVGGPRCRALSTLANAG